MNDLDIEYRENIRSILKTVKSIRGVLIFFLLIIVFQLFFQCGDSLFSTI